jgi:hypothetical protein
MDKDVTPTMKQFQWTSIHWYSLKSDVLTLKPRRNNTKQKADVSNAIDKVTWHVIAQLRRNNLSNNLTNRTGNSDLLYKSHKEV